MMDELFPHPFKNPYIFGRRAKTVVAPPAAKLAVFGLALAYQLRLIRIYVVFMTIVLSRYMNLKRNMEKEEKRAQRRRCSQK